MTSTGDDAKLYSPSGLEIDGSKNYALRLKVRCTSHSFTGNTYLYHSTSATTSTNILHNADSKFKAIPIGGATVWEKDVYQFLVWDMREPTDTIDDDYLKSTIKQFRIDFINSVTHHFEIDGFVYGTFGAADRTNYEATQAQADACKRCRDL